MSRSASRDSTQQKMLRAIANHVWEFGYQPSLREIAGYLGWSSPGYVQVLLHDLRNKGVVQYDGNQARSVRFNWQQYVTGSFVSRDFRHQSGVDPRKRAVAKKRRHRKLGAVSKS